jgi:hypothetical protein
MSSSERCATNAASSSSGATSTAATRLHHYSTFTNDIQAQRLAALQPEHIEKTSAITTFATSVSSSVSNLFRTALYRLATACLPCWEFAVAINLVPVRSSRKAEEEAAVSTSELECGGSKKKKDEDQVTLLSEAGSENGSGAKTNVRRSTAK